MSVEQISNQNQANALKSLNAQNQALQQMYNELSTLNLQLRTQFIFVSEQLQEANHKYAELEKKLNEQPEVLNDAVNS